MKNFQSSGTKCDDRIIEKKTWVEIEEIFTENLNKKRNSKIAILKSASHCRQNLSTSKALINLKTIHTRVFHDVCIQYEKKICIKQTKVSWQESPGVVKHAQPVSLTLKLNNGISPPKSAPVASHWRISWNTPAFSSHCKFFFN